MNSPSNDAPAEDDSLQVEQRHVEAFLKWYGARVRLPQYVGFGDHWWHALQTLTLGELRHGVRFLQSLTRMQYIEPVAFHPICKNRRPPRTSAHIRALRETLKDQSQEPTK